MQFLRFPTIFEILQSWNFHNVPKFSIFLLKISNIFKFSRNSKFFNFYKMFEIFVIFSECLKIFLYKIWCLFWPIESETVQEVHNKVNITFSFCTLSSLLQNEKWHYMRQALNKMQYYYIMICLFYYFESWLVSLDHGTM